MGFNKFRPGDYLVIDDITGDEIWASEAGYDWDGSIRRKSEFDGEHPQLRPKFYAAEHYPKMVNEAATVTAYVCGVSQFVGNTTVTANPHSPVPTGSVR